MGKGKLIIIESGSDASGKATQSQRLYERLIQEGKKCLKITFPDYDSDSSALVKMYLNGDFGKNPSAVNPYISSTFYAADRYASYKTKWGEFYNNGGIIISDGAKGGDGTHLITQQKVRGAAGNVEQQHLLGEQRLAFRCIQRRRSVPLLMGGVNQRNAPRRCKGSCRTDTGQKAGHITALYRTRLLRNTHSIYFCQVEFLRQLL